MKIGQHFGVQFVDAPKPVQVITPAPAVPTTALARFQLDPAALKDSALSLLAIKVKPVNTREEAAYLANQRAQAKTILKDIEARRKLMVEPLKKEAAAVDAEARTWADPVKAWDRQAEQVLLAYQRLEADRTRRAAEAQQEALRKAAEAQAAAEQVGDAEAVEAASVAVMVAEAAPVAEPVKGWHTDAGSQSLRKRWTVEVVDPEEVPDVYMVPDLPRLQAAVNAGAREIPGCNIYEAESLVVRTRG